MYHILFYHTNKPYGCFSNFAQYPIKIDGKLWPTSEHYFQAMKFENTAHEEIVLNAPTPMEAARIGRERNRPLREDWELIKEDIMRKSVAAKIHQHSEVKNILLSTGIALLVEHTKNDSYWGDGGDGSGQNRLGHILMELRTSLEGYSPEFYLPQWLAFPDVDPIDMFWSMGQGEEYISRYGRWFYSLSSDAREQYEQYFRPSMPENWGDVEKLMNGGQ